MTSGAAGCGDVRGKVATCSAVNVVEMANYSYSYEAYGTYPYANAQYGNTSPTITHARASVPRRASTQRELKRVDEADLVLGRVFWLPPKEELPPRAVRRAHGKGAVEEGIYNHPIVVISRPAEEPEAVHFQIVRLNDSTLASTLYSHTQRSLPSKASVFTRYTQRTMSSMLRAGHGIFPYGRHRAILMPPRRRHRNVSRPWNCKTVQPSDGILTSTSAMCTK